MVVVVSSSSRVVDRMVDLVDWVVVRWRRDGDNGSGTLLGDRHYRRPGRRRRPRDRRTAVLREWRAITRRPIMAALAITEAPGYYGAYGPLLAPGLGAGRQLAMDARLLRRRAYIASNARKCLDSFSPCPW